MCAQSTFTLVFIPVNVYFDTTLDVQRVVLCLVTYLALVSRLYTIPSTDFILLLSKITQIPDAGGGRHRTPEFLATSFVLLPAISPVLMCLIYDARSCCVQRMLYEYLHRATGGWYAHFFFGTNRNLLYSRAVSYCYLENIVA